ncbi:MAG: DoxX family membrane protein [Pyrinomonadaceae bacterium]
MAPLIVLLATFAILAAADKFVLRNRLGSSLVGRIAMSAMLLVTGIAHFTSTDLMVEIMPDITPMKRELVYFTGICELAAAVGLILQRTSRLAAILLIIFFIAVLPANIAGSLKQVNLGGMEYGAAYLFFRVPLQIFLIWWVYYFGLRKNPVIF